MEIFRLGEEGEFSNVYDFAVDENGNIYVLYGSAFQGKMTKFNFRGEPQADFSITGLPSDMKDFKADRIIYKNKKLYFVQTGSLTIVVTDMEGRYQTGYALTSRIELDEEKDSSTLIMFGFDVDDEGNILFTIPVLFSAFRLSKEGELERFGTSGSSPGQFGVVSGIAADDHGYYYVTDRLRSAVLVFNKDFTFQTEFGFRGNRPGNLIVPDDIAVDGRGYVYVSQAAKRGISVFRVHYE